jgi:hypothetical protein
MGNPLPTIGEMSVKEGLRLAHLMKHTKAVCGHMFKHYERARDEDGEYIRFGNQDIDTSLSGSNYNLAPDRGISQGDFLRQRCSEVRLQNRKDVNVMCSWVMTAPKELQEEELNQFFSASYSFLNNRYGDENVVSAYVHMDEATPHMHYAFVPVVEDKKNGGYKVSAKEAITRGSLRAFHKDYDAHMTNVFGRDIGVLNGATKDGNKSIEELKRGSAAEIIGEANREAKQIVAAANKEAQEADKQVAAARQKLAALEGKAKSMEGNVLTKKQLDKIQPEAGMLGTIKGITLEDVQNLKKTAMEYYLLNDKHKELRGAYKKLNDKVPSEAEKLETEKKLSEFRQLKKDNAYLRSNEKCVKMALEKYADRIPAEPLEAIRAVLGGLQGRSNPIQEQSLARE